MMMICNPQHDEAITLKSVSRVLILARPGGRWLLVASQRYNICLQQVEPPSQEAHYTAVHLSSLSTHSLRHSLVCLPTNTQVLNTAGVNVAISTCSTYTKQVLCLFFILMTYIHEECSSPSWL